MKKKGRRAPLDPDDVIAGRAKPSARELIALIHDVNPTGRGLPQAHAARRYAQKSRLQSALIARFQGDIDVRAEPREPGVVALSHIPSGLDACHAVIAELDDDARSWVQRAVDLAASEPGVSPPSDAPPPEPRADAAAAAAAGEAREAAHDEAGAESAPSARYLSPAELLAAGKEAALEFDFVKARARFESALERSSGAASAASALLSLLVDHLAADEDALALEGKLSQGALRDPLVRALLALAAARRNERQRALHLLKEPGAARASSSQSPHRRAEAPPARVADVYAELARASIDEGRLDQAAQDVARARELAPAHPALLGLSDALAKRRAAEREPAETELSRVFALGDIDAAERGAQALLARWADSEVGRRIARAVLEHRRRAQAEELLAAGREAIAAGQMTAGTALLRRALASGLQREDAAWAEERVAAIEGEARAREEQARASEVRGLILAGDLGRALPAYAALDARGREIIRGAEQIRELQWLDALAPPDSGAKVKGAVQAVLSLSRAAAIAALEPEAALDALALHAKALEGFEPAAEVAREARRALAELRKTAARRAVEAAGAAFEAGSLERADDLLRGAALKDLPDAEQAAAEGLKGRVRRLLERKVLIASVDQPQAEGDELRALAALDALVALSDDAERPRLDALREELRAGAQRRFLVDVERFDSDERDERDERAEGAAPERLWDAEVSCRKVWRSLLVRPSPSAGGPDDIALVLAQARGEWVFIRLIDAASGRLRARATLRTPVAVDPIAAHLCGSHLLLVGRRAALLEVDVDTFHVQRFCANILRTGEAMNRTLPGRQGWDPKFPESTVDDAIFMPDGQTLILKLLSSAGHTAKCSLHVLELGELRPIRELNEPRHNQVNIRSVAGLSAPRFIVGLNEDESLQLYDHRGLPDGARVAKACVHPNTITASPDGERVFMIGNPPNGSEDPSQAAWGFMEMAKGALSPMRMFEGVTAVYSAAAMTSFSAGMTFALFQIRHRGCELFALRPGGSDGARAGGVEPERELEIVYRVTLPRRSMLLGDPESRRAFVLTSRGARAEIIELGATPPPAEGGDASAVFHLPRTPNKTVNTTPAVCWKPTGARLAAATALHKLLRREAPGGIKRRIQAAQTRTSPDELLTLADALRMMNNPGLSADVSTLAYRRFPRHARTRFREADPLLDLGRWSEALQFMDTVDPKGLDKSEVKHFYHERGLAWMMLDNTEAALEELKRAEACEEGTCEVGELIAVCTPLGDDTREWTPEEAVLRELMALIAAADEALARGDGASARRSLDCPLVWEAYEVQSFARLAEAYLIERKRAADGDEGGAAAGVDPFRMAFALLSFCDLAARRGTFNAREMALPRAAWRAPRLDALAAKARRRAEQALGLA
jgi:hypothetical protein